MSTKKDRSAWLARSAEGPTLPHGLLAVSPSESGNDMDRHFESMDKWVDTICVERDEAVSEKQRIITLLESLRDELIAKYPEEGLLTEERRLLRDISERIHSIVCSSK